MNEFDRVVGAGQVILLVLWELLGALWFGWSPWAIAALWVVGIVTLNVGVATCLRTYIKLTSPRTASDLPIEAPVIDEEDHVG